MPSQIPSGNHLPVWYGILGRQADSIIILLYYRAVIVITVAPCTEYGALQMYEYRKRRSGLCGDLRLVQGLKRSQSPHAMEARRISN